MKYDNFARNYLETRKEEEGGLKKKVAVFQIAIPGQSNGVSFGCVVSVASLQCCFPSHCLSKIF